MLINEVCKKCGLTKKAIEYYEEQGLTHPQIMGNGYRMFSEDDVIQLNKIAVLRLFQNGRLPFTRFFGRKRQAIYRKRQVPVPQAVKRAFRSCFRPLKSIRFSFRKP